MYPATHIVRTCHYECQTQCTQVRVLVSTCYIQTIESSARGHGQLWPITGSEHFFWPLTFRHTMFSPYISAETSASFFFSFEICEKWARKQKRCLGANLGPGFFPKLFQGTSQQFITETPLSGRGEEQTWATGTVRVIYYRLLSGTRFLLSIYANHNLWVCTAFNGKFFLNPNSIHRHNNTNIRGSQTSLFVYFFFVASYMYCLLSVCIRPKKDALFCRAHHSLQTWKLRRRWRWLAPILRRLQEVQIVKLWISSHLIRE